MIIAFLIWFLLPKEKKYYMNLFLFNAYIKEPFVA